MQRSVTDALAAQKEMAEKIAAAVATERAAATAMRSDDITGVQAGNRLLREQLASATEDTRDRDRRILELLARVDTLQQEVARLNSERADVSLVLHREQRQIELTRAQMASADERFRAVMGHLAPLVPLVARAGLSAAVKAGAISGTPGTGPVSIDPQAPTVRAPGSVPEVLQAAVWTQAKIDEWKAALCEFVMAASPPTAAAFRFYLCETNVSA
jgi:hypothetical protein